MWNFSGVVVGVAACYWKDRVRVYIYSHMNLEEVYSLRRVVPEVLVLLDIYGLRDMAIRMPVCTYSYTPALLD